MDQIREKIDLLSLSTRSMNKSFDPLFFEMSNENDRKSVLEMLEKNEIIFVVEEYAEQQRELFFTNNPGKIQNKDIYTQKTKEPIDLQEGVWVFYPWRKTLVHVLPPKEYQKLRESRNHDLITHSEQKILGGLSIGFAGLNVGNPGAVCAALEGVGASYKFADIDELSVSNLNRFRAGLADLGLNKAVLSARQVYEINPFTKIQVFGDGIFPGNIRDFLKGLDILVEETDNLKIKLELRKEAKKKRMPVIMVTGDGPHIVIDVERYDLKSDLRILNGLMDKKIMDKINAFDPGASSAFDRVILARDFIGEKYFSKRLNKSFLEFGKTLPSIPQLAESSFLRGSLLCFIIRQIFAPERKTLKSGRYHIDLKNISRIYEKS